MPEVMLNLMASPGHVTPQSPAFHETSAFFKSSINTTCAVQLTSPMTSKTKPRIVKHRPPPLTILKTTCTPVTMSPLATASPRLTTDIKPISSPVPLRRKQSSKRGRKRPGALNIPLTISTATPGHLDKLTPPPFLTSTTPPNTASKINNKMYLGSAVDAQNEHLYQSTNITQVLSIVSSDKFSLPETANVKQLHIKLNDMSDQAIADHFKKAIQFIMSNPTGSTLIHCRAGISRSSTLVMACLMESNHWTLNKAFSFVKSKRSCVAPNFGFLGQLQKFETELAEKWKLMDSD